MKFLRLRRRLQRARLEGAIRAKARKLGLEVVKKTPRKFSTTSLKIPKELPSVEEALKILAGTLETLRIKWDLNPPWDLVPVREGSVCTLCFQKALRLPSSYREIVQKVP